MSNESSSSVVGATEEGGAGAVLRGGAPAEVAAGVCGVGAVTPAPVAAELDSPAGRPRDASTGEVVLSPADRPGSDAAGTGVSPGPVPAAPAEPPSRSLVLFERQVDMEVWFRDDAIAAEAFGSHDDDRWFKCGDYDADPMCWENVLCANKDVWPSLLTRSDMAPLVPTDGAS